jgi:hypothetical protein
MTKHIVDFHHVQPDHKLTHDMLLNWALWVAVRPQYSVHPMFRQYRSHAWQWHSPGYRPTCDILQAQEVEKLMRHLPKRHRDALVWSYVVRSGPAHARKVLACSYSELGELINQGRSMVSNLWARHNQAERVAA